MNIKAMRLYSIALGVLLAISFAPLLNSQAQQAYAFHVDDDELGGGIGVLTTKFSVNGKLVDWSETRVKEKFFEPSWFMPFSAVNNDEPLETMRLTAHLRLDPASEHGFERYETTYIRFAEPKAFIYPNGDPRGFGVPWDTTNAYFITHVPNGHSALGQGGSEVMLFDVTWTQKELEQAAANCRSLQNACRSAQGYVGFTVYADVSLQLRVVEGSIAGIPINVMSVGTHDSSAGYSAGFVMRDGKFYTKVTDLLAEVHDPSDVTCDLIVSLFGQCGPDQVPIKISFEDTDGDGLPNTIDADIDGDGTLNETDPDIDGDGLPNGIDFTPTGQLNAEQSESLVDTDGDGKANIEDNDIDADGVQNAQDPDIDGDGLLNGQDVDIDGDDIRNVDDPDIDGDGTSNGQNDADIDSDGQANNQDNDMDGDGVINRQDNDMDGDGILNAFDPDIDGDGLLNGEDPDMDGDGILNEQDSDIDGDNIENTQDEIPGGAAPAQTGIGNYFGENTMLVYGSLGMVAALLGGGGLYLHKRRK